MLGAKWGQVNVRGIAIAGGKIRIPRGVEAERLVSWELLERGEGVRNVSP